MKNTFIIIAILGISLSAKAQNYSTKDVNIHFFSSAPISDIEAVCNIAIGKFNLRKKELSIEMNISDFKFKKALMQAHFNEKYIESDKYPKAIFKGTFKDYIDLEKNGLYKINLEGKFTIHGVERSKKIICTLNVKDQIITFTSNFEIISADYKIKAPDMIYRKVGEKVNVDINGTLILDPEK